MIFGIIFRTHCGACSFTDLAIYGLVGPSKKTALIDLMVHVWPVHLPSQYQFLKEKFNSSDSPSELCHIKATTSNVTILR